MPCHCLTLPQCKGLGVNRVSNQGHKFLGNLNGIDLPSLYKKDASPGFAWGDVCFPILG